MFELMVAKNYDRSFGASVALYGHRHFEKWPVHIHLMIMLGFWFIEFQFGRSEPKYMK